jgi:hypothetical protein
MKNIVFVTIVSAFLCPDFGISAELSAAQKSVNMLDQVHKNKPVGDWDKEIDVRLAVAALTANKSAKAAIDMLDQVHKNKPIGDWNKEIDIELAVAALGIQSTNSIDINNLDPNAIVNQLRPRQGSNGSIDDVTRVKKVGSPQHSVDQGASLKSSGSLAQ